MQTTEDAIWDLITDSAKRKFDYPSFQSLFCHTGGEPLPENLLFKIIVGFASNQTVRALKSELRQDLAPLELGLDDRYFDTFLAHKEQELEIEIRATRLALDSLQRGATPAAVKRSVLDLLH